MHELAKNPELIGSQLTTYHEDKVQIFNDHSTGQMTLANNNLRDFPLEAIKTPWDWITTLDLTNNNIRNVDFISNFDSLQTLVLDHNLISETTLFPIKPQLKILWINFNRIQNVETFVEQLSVVVPRLQILSLMGNPNVPNRINGSSFHDYALYRMMVLAKLPWINFLDDRGVDPKEALDALEFQSYHNSKWNSALAELGPVEKKIGQFVKTAKDRTIASGTHQLERTKGALNIFFNNWKSSRLNRPKSRFA